MLNGTTEYHDTFCHHFYSQTIDLYILCQEIIEMPMKLIVSSKQFSTCKVEAHAKAVMKHTAEW